MQNKFIYLFLAFFLPVAMSLARADQAPVAVPDAHARLSDEALASYISGRLKLALKDEGSRIEQYCDASGCSVVVQ